jgi:hypothetical protein
LAELPENANCQKSPFRKLYLSKALFPSYMKRLFLENSDFAALALLDLQIVDRLHVDAHLNAALVRKLLFGVLRPLPTPSATTHFQFSIQNGSPDTI